MKNLGWVSGVAVLGFAASGLAQGNLLVISKQAHTLAVVDGKSLKVLGTAPVGEDPHEVIASSDGKEAYVSNYGGGPLHTLTVIDLVGIKPEKVVELGAVKGPHGLVFVGGKTWFTAQGAKVVGRYDPVSDKVDMVLGTALRAHMIWVSADGQRMVATDPSSASLSVMERVKLRMPGPPPPAAGQGGGGSVPPPQLGPEGDGKDWVETVLKVGNGSEGFDVSPDGRAVWVANARDATVSVIDLVGLKVMATLQVNAEGANRLKFTPDGGKVLVGTPEGVEVIDVASRAVVKRIVLGKGASGIQMEPNGARAFVSCNRDGYVAVVDLKTMTMVGKIDAGGEPDGLAWVTGRE